MTDPAYPDALPAQSRLHWYVIDKVLGQGGFGITYLARDTNLDQRVAIKEYLPVEFATRMPDATVRSRTDELRDRYRWGLDRFIQEARTLARFDHPSIVRVKSVFEFNNTAYMVMRFEEGINLAALLDRRGTLPENELLRILLPILDGLQGVHQAGFIHRDIKPDNIHIGDDGRPVLLDFGSARQAVGNAHTLTILVAPGYAPFEQYYSDSGNQGPWTDIYGLGATCYRAIAGRSPLDAVSRSKGILGSTQDVLVPATVIGAGRYSGRFLAAIDHALEFAEKDRPQTVEAWRQELVGEPSVPPPAAAVAVPASAFQNVAATRSVLPPAAAAAVPSPPAGTVEVEPPAAAVPHEPQPVAPGRAGSTSSRRAIAVVSGLAILAVGVGAYLAFAERASDSRARIAALEKQIQDKELADAARQRALQQKQDDEVRQRREQELQAQAAQEKSRAEAAARSTVGERSAAGRAAPESARVADKKRPDEPARPAPQVARAASTAVPPVPAASAPAVETATARPALRAAATASRRKPWPSPRRRPPSFRHQRPSPRSRRLLHRRQRKRQPRARRSSSSPKPTARSKRSVSPMRSRSSGRSPTRATRARKPGWATRTWKGAAFHATMPRRADGTKRPRCRAKPAPRSSSPPCTSTATACSATTTWPTSGSAPPPASARRRPGSSRRGSPRCCSRRNGRRPTS